jgi:hypothetical protein
VEGQFVGQRLLPAVVLTVMGLFVLDRGAVLEGAVQAVGVAPVHPGRGGEFEVGDPAEGAVVADGLGLVEPDDALGHRVVVGVTDRCRSSRAR